VIGVSKNFTETLVERRCSNDVIQACFRAMMHEDPSICHRIRPILNDVCSTNVQLLAIFTTSHGLTWSHWSPANPQMCTNFVYAYRLHPTFGPFLCSIRTWSGIRIYALGLYIQPYLPGSSGSSNLANVFPLRQIREDASAYVDITVCHNLGICATPTPVSIVPYYSSMVGKNLFGKNLFAFHVALPFTQSSLVTNKVGQQKFRGKNVAVN
jgi:hypothetical protein